MARNTKAPAVQAGAIDDLLSGGSKLSFNLVAFRQQVVIASFGVPTELAAAVAALAFNGGAHG